MSATSALTAVLAIGAFTYLSRAGLILALSQRLLPDGVIDLLRNVGPAVLSALVVTILAGSGGASEIDVANAVGVLAGGAVAWKTRNLFFTLVVGMAVVWATAALI